MIHWVSVGPIEGELLRSSKKAIQISLGKEKLPGVFKVLSIVFSYSWTDIRMSCNLTRALSLTNLHVQPNSDSGKWLSPLTTLPFLVLQATKEKKVSSISSSNVSSLHPLYSVSAPTTSCSTTWHCFLKGNLASSFSGGRGALW